MNAQNALSHLQPRAVYLRDVAPVVDLELLAHYCRQCQAALDEVHTARLAVDMAKRAGARRALSTAKQDLLFWSRSARSWRELVTGTRDAMHAQGQARRVSAGGR